MNNNNVSIFAITAALFVVAIPTLRNIALTLIIAKSTYDLTKELSQYNIKQITQELTTSSTQTQGISGYVKCTHGFSKCTIKEQ